MKFEEKLVRLRKRQGMSQEELAERLGVSRQAVSRWELGSTLPDVPNLRKLSELFGVSADDLIRDDRELDEAGASAPESMAGEMQHVDAPPGSVGTDALAEKRRGFLISAAAWSAATVCFFAAGIVGRNIWATSLSVADLLLAIRSFRRYRAEDDAWNR